VPAPAEYAPAVKRVPSDPVLALLGRQAASGLWEEAGKDPVATTAAALVALLRLGVTTDHAVHGALVKKAIEALVEWVTAHPQTDLKSLELALGVAWLLTSGRRTRKSIEERAKAHGALATLGQTFGNEPAVRAHVDKIATA
jgi:Ca-activated chloride channel family protein